MSGVYAIVLVSLWIWLSWHGIRGWSKARDRWPSKRRWADTAAMIAALAWFGTSFWFGGGRKIYWDERVRELCAIDGGVRVYEKVRLPPDKFNQWGQINFYRPDHGENALGAEYIFNSELTYLRMGNPSLHRYKVEVIRRVDRKVLGESIGYSRGGGDLPGPWQPSSFSCQQVYGDVPLLTEIFTRD